MSWYPNINYCYKDCHTITGLYGTGGQSQFDKAIKTDASLVLAATWSNQQKGLNTAMKKSGFKLVAIGKRSEGHDQGSHICLWKRQKGKKLSKKTVYEDSVNYKNHSALQFNCCGIHVYATTNDLFKDSIISVLRVEIAKEPKVKVPRRFRLFATTKLARYYVADFTKFFVT